MALRLRESSLLGPGNDLDAWEAELGLAQAKVAMMGGDLESGVAYTGAGSGLISDILTVDEVFKELVDGSQSLSKALA